ncbi:patatin-like phospholipase family protein [Arcanobacterium haemolyticum]|nr:patatin-like phospholipase family protein [Arcanobacterium haemolyticum]
MRIALVLGSGGARGYAHIGVIDELKARGHEIVTIAGTSMGALIGGLEASGSLGEFKEWALKLNQLQVFRRVDFSFAGAGMVRGDRIIDEIDTFWKGARIEDLPIPFTAVACDVTAQREVWFQRGPVASAVRASIGIPGVFTPVSMRGHTLVDGGVVNPVPIEPTFSVHSDVTVAVSLAGRPGLIQPALSLTDAGDVHEETGSKFPGAGIAETLKSVSARFFGGHDDEEESHLGEFVTQSESEGDLIERNSSFTSTTEVLLDSLATMQGMIERYRAAASPAQVTISVPEDSAGTLEFHRAGELIELGQGLAEEAFDRAGI